MAWTRADVDKLDRAIASGTLSVRYGDRTITYQSTDAMIKARKLMLSEVEPAEGKTPRRRTFRLYQSGRGY